MRVSVNGRDRDLHEGATVADLVKLLELEPRRIAVERNGRIVPRRTFAESALADGDVLEIVTLVGGGRARRRTRRREPEIAP